jgi:cardiolipin synthase
MAIVTRNSRQHVGTRALAAVGIGALVLYAARIALDLFGPVVPYRMSDDVGVALDSDEFIRFLSVVTAATTRRSRITRLKNGPNFYPAELETIRRAKHTVNLVFYEFSPGQVSGEMLAALIERAKAGVEVRVIVDAMGSFSTSSSYFDGLRAAGGKMRWYHPIRWDTWPRLINRTHRKILVVDGETGFVGGARVADHWMKKTASGPAWRDSMFCVEGEAVAGLISTFCENWLECAGEILAGRSQFDVRAMPGGSKCFVVSSTPHSGGTQARVLFQGLITSAKETIRITTPYFLPDRSARKALIEAVGRGVKVQILTAGAYIDHPMVRKMSRRSSRTLLIAGAEIYDYQPSMIHAKLLTVDGQWSVVGSTNFDHRSFALNDEVNLAVLDRKLAEVIDGDFFEDLKRSRRLSKAMLQKSDGMSAGMLDYAMKKES